MHKYICLFLFVAGCSYQPNAVDVEIDPSFNIDQQSIIIGSLNDWNNKTHKFFGIHNITFPDKITGIGEFNKIKFIRTDNAPSDFGGKGIIWGDTYSTTHRPFDPAQQVNAVVYIYDQLDDNAFNATSRHEIGHALGLSHICNNQEAALENQFNAKGLSKCVEINDDMATHPSVMYPEYYDLFFEVEPDDVFQFCRVWNCDFWEQPNGRG